MANFIPRLHELPDVLTAEQVAAVLQCSTEHVYTMWRKREMPHFKVGRLVRIHKQALVEWMERQQTSTTPVPASTVTTGPHSPPDRTRC